MVRRYQEPAFRLAYLLLGDAAEAEDITQDAFVRAFLHLAGMVQAPLVVEGNVLVWSAGDVIYRLESALPLVEAVRIAESLAERSQPAPEGGFENCPVTLPTDSPYTPQQKATPRHGYNHKVRSVSGAGG